jgi:uncharacterized protein YndB with AHSA1/START domain
MTRSIILSVETDADKDTIYRALTTIDGLASFWTPAVDGNPDLGGTLRFGFAAAPAELEMTVAELTPSETVVWNCAGPWPYWGGTHIEWTIGNGRVTFVQDGWSEDQAEAEFGAVAYTWAMVLTALTAHVETGDAAPALS